jgi:putative flippase GtrA
MGHDNPFGSRRVTRPIEPIEDGTGRIGLFDSARAKLRDAWRNRALGFKAASFALIGLVNTGVDYGIFLLTHATYERCPAVLAAAVGFTEWCHCGSPQTFLLIAANTTSWIVAITGSYVMNSSITFAVESGRRLRWRHYAAFVGSSAVGLIANTVTLVVAVQILLLSVWLAKAIAVLANFVVNFSLAHYVVFRARGER